MRKLFLTLAICAGFLLCSLSAFAQAPENPREFEMKDGDTTYVMKQYIFGMYIRGDRSKEYSEEELKEIQAGHMANMDKYAKEGKILVAGPMGDDGEWRGILIFDVATVEEAEEMLKNDPAVQAGRLKYELHPWWGAKGTILK